ncbi:MAG: metalloregulator ArsR/SmtB family transcription factor [Clostridiaceae bacterium]
MNKLTDLFKVLSDETRLKILVILYERKICVCQLQGLLNETQPKISKHLSILRNMGFVKVERKEQFIYYYIDEENQLLKEILEKIIENSDNYPDLISIVNKAKQQEYLEEIKNKCKI